MHMIEKNELGEAIRKARLLRGLNQEDLSKLANIPQPTISRIEKGKRMPGSDILLQIANALNTSPDEFFQDAGKLNKISESKAPYVVINPLMERLVNTAKQLNKFDLDLLADFGELLLCREIEARGEKENGIYKPIPG